MHVETGRLSKNVVMTGTVLFNGKKRKLGYGDVVSTLSLFQIF